MVKLRDGVWADARLRYERGEEAVDAIAADVGISSATLRRRVRHEGWLRPSEAALQPPDEEKLLSRLFRAFQRQIEDLEQRFGAEAGGVEERDARTLAVLAKTFETLAKLREGRSEEEAAIGEEGEDVDLDELRTRLARQLEALPPYEEMAGGGAGAVRGADHEPG